MKKSFIDAFCDFMEDPDGLTKEDLIAELEDHGIDVVSLGIKVRELTKATQLDKGGGDAGMSLEKRVAKAYGLDKDSG